MYQPSLFSPSAYGAYQLPTPIAATGDPATSHESAARLPRSDRAKRHREIVLALVRTWPGLTGHEIWNLANAADRAELGDHCELYRKLNDLKHAGLVAQGEARLCTVRHVRMAVWYPATTGTA